MLHNHNPDATWETALVIPEAAKPVDVQILDTLLRIEVLLLSLAGTVIPAHIDGDLSQLFTDITPTETPFLSSISADEKPKKGKRKS